MRQTKKMVIAAMFAALACVATMAIRIPTPGTGGYIHPGDAVVILCGIFLNPGAAFLASGMGSAMADLCGGSYRYVPITFVIKGLVAFLAGHAFRRLSGHLKNRTVAVAICGLIDVALVAGGYCFCESFIYGTAAAFASVPANLIQGASGLVISTALFPLLAAVPDMKRMMAAR